MCKMSVLLVLLYTLFFLFYFQMHHIHTLLRYFHLVQHILSDLMHHIDNPIFHCLLLLKNAFSFVIFYFLTHHTYKYIFLPILLHDRKFLPISLRHYNDSLFLDSLMFSFPLTAQTYHIHNGQYHPQQ